MSRKLLAASTVFALAMLAFAGVASPAAAHTAHTIVVTTTIQAAVDAAQPGDTVLVPPGIYRESVLVSKSHLRIVGSRAAVSTPKGSGPASGSGPGGSRATVLHQPAHPSRWRGSRSWG